MKTPPVITDILCPKCSSPLYLRSGTRGRWLGCSKFPKCRGRLAWSSLDESIQKHWEAVMADHQKAHPAVFLTMLNGKPVPMTVAVDDIILKAEEAGLVCNAVEDAVAE